MGVRAYNRPMNATTNDIDWIAMTADEIRERARAFNAGFDEAMSLIDEGEPMIRVTVIGGGGSGRNYRAIAAPGILASVLGCAVWIGAGADLIEVLGGGYVRSRDGRLSHRENAQRRFGSLLREALVPVQWVER